jgi:hypothetical protein
MPRWGEWIRLPDGNVAHVLHSGPRPKLKRCRCGARATQECDFPLLAGGTCDKPLCKSCAVRKGPDVDWCPEHIGPGE